MSTMVARRRRGGSEACAAGPTQKGRQTRAGSRCALEQVELGGGPVVVEGMGESWARRLDVVRVLWEWLVSPREDVDLEAGDGQSDQGF